MLESYDSTIALRSNENQALLSTVKLAMTQMTIIDLFPKYLVYIDELSGKSFDFEIIFIVKIQRR